MSDPTEKRLEEMAQDWATEPMATLYNEIFKLGVSTPTPHVEVCNLILSALTSAYLEGFRAQARELAALKEPMACGHPRACLKAHSVIGTPESPLEVDEVVCEWCESEKALR